MIDFQLTLAMQRSHRAIAELFEETNPHNTTLHTAGEAKLEPLRFKFFWKIPKIKKTKIQTRVPVR